MSDAASASTIDPFEPRPEPRPGGVVSFGNFDGVHRGHCRLLAALRDEARCQRVPAVAATFDPHPLTLLRPGSAPDPLTTLARKIELLRACGADEVVVIQTTPRLLDLAPDEFFAQVVQTRLRARGLVEGPNFGFGKGRAGNIETLRDLCSKSQLSLRVVPALSDNDRTVSSSEIRRRLSTGDVAGAADLLGRPHQIEGQVIVGDRRGASIGFPTANLGSIQTAVPADGVYAVHVTITNAGGEPSTYQGACNIGPNPTFDSSRSKVEVHLLGFTGDLYGRTLALDILKRLRPVQRFESVDQLRRQITIDVERAAQCQLSSSAGNERELELLKTIEEWIGLETKAALGVSPSRLLLASGKLTIEWPQMSPAPPHQWMDLLLRFESRLQHVFPEVAVCKIASV